MRRIVLALTGTISGLLMLFSYHTSLAGTATPTVTGGVTTYSAGSSSSGTTSSSGSGSTTPAAGSGTYTGDVVSTQWGPVQVRVTLVDGTVDGVDVLQYPQGNSRDAQINGYALPILTEETIGASTANIDHVSGATVTSGGYIASLQSALDQAQL